MARVKGLKMTEEAKIAMRAKREANRLGKESAFVTVWDSLRLLTYTQLATIAGEVQRLLSEKKEDEKMKLIKMKESIENRLKELTGE